MSAITFRPQTFRDQNTLITPGHHLGPDTGQRTPMCLVNVRHILPLALHTYVHKHKLCSIGSHLKYLWNWLIIFVIDNQFNLIKIHKVDKDNSWMTFARGIDEMDLAVSIHTKTVIAFQCLNWLGDRLLRVFHCDKIMTDKI